MDEKCVHQYTTENKDDLQRWWDNQELFPKKVKGEDAKDILLVDHTFLEEKTTELKKV